MLPGLRLAEPILADSSVTEAVLTDGIAKVPRLALAVWNDG